MSDYKLQQRVPECGPEDQQATCCVVGCGKKATKLIFTPGAVFYDSYTHSCDDHVGDLMETEEDVIQDLC